MKPSIKSHFLAVIAITSVLLVGCNLRKTTGSGPGSSAGPFIIGGVVTGLSSGSTGMVLQNNSGDNLTVSGNGPFLLRRLSLMAKISMFRF
jgi:hypothetical protein